MATTTPSLETKTKSEAGSETKLDADSTPKLSDITTSQDDFLSKTEFSNFLIKFKNYLETGTLPNGLKDETALNLYIQGYLSEDQRQALTDESIKYQKLNADSNPHTKNRGFVVVWEKVKPTLTTSCQKILTQVNPPWNVKENMKTLETLENMLNKGVFEEVMNMREYLQAKNKIAKFAGEVYIVLLDNGIKAVWKPRDGDHINSAVAEVVAYQASKWLEKYSGRHLVPPTIIKTFRGRTGSLQYFVESDFDLWLEKDRSTVNSRLSKDNFANAAAFIHVLGQWDAHPGNRMATIDDNNEVQITLIDNEGIANRKYSPSITERPYVRVAYGTLPQGTPLFITLKNPKKDEIQKAWAPFSLGEKRLNNLYQILSGNGERDANFMLWNNGLWLQYHQRNKDAFPNHVDYYPFWLQTAYEDLTPDVLKSIFALGLEAIPRFFNDAFFQDILSRKKQLLDAIKMQNSSRKTSAQHPLKTSEQSVPITSAQQIVVPGARIQPAHISTTADAALQMVFDKLSLPDLLPASSVSKQFNRLISQNQNATPEKQRRYALTKSSKTKFFHLINRFQRDHLRSFRVCEQMRLKQLTVGRALKNSDILKRHLLHPGIECIPLLGFSLTEVGLKFSDDHGAYLKMVATNAIIKAKEEIYSLKEKIQSLKARQISITSTEQVQEINDANITDNKDVKETKESKDQLETKPNIEQNKLHLQRISLMARDSLYLNFWKSASATLDLNQADLDSDEERGLEFYENEEELLIIQEKVTEALNRAYESICNLQPFQVQALLLGIPLEFVKWPTFSISHLNFARSLVQKLKNPEIIPYNFSVYPFSMGISPTAYLTHLLYHTPQFKAEFAKTQFLTSCQLEAIETAWSEKVPQPLSESEVYLHILDSPFIKRDSKTQELARKACRRGWDLTLIYDLDDDDIQKILHLNWKTKEEIERFKKLMPWEKEAVLAGIPLEFTLQLSKELSEIHPASLRNLIELFSRLYKKLASEYLHLKNNRVLSCDQDLSIEIKDKKESRESLYSLSLVPSSTQGSLDLKDRKDIEEDQKHKQEEMFKKFCEYLVEYQSLKPHQRDYLLHTRNFHDIDIATKLKSPLATQYLIIGMSFESIQKLNDQELVQPHSSTPLDHTTETMQTSQPVTVQIPKTTDSTEQKRQKDTSKKGMSSNEGSAASVAYSSSDSTTNSNSGNTSRNDSSSASSQTLNSVPKVSRQKTFLPGYTRKYLGFGLAATTAIVLGVKIATRNTT